MPEILIGADPEVFFKRGDKFISSVGLIGGTKDAPRNLRRKGFNIHEDNVTVEYNIPPCSNVNSWVENHKYALEAIADVGRSHGCEIAIVSDGTFDEDQLQTEGARTFGCNPDYDAWKIDVNPAPAAHSTNLRTAGGHIHIGAELTVTEKIELVRVLDIFLGIPLNLLEPESKRQQLYGKLGACRPKPYGVEYRVPSNYWLRSEELMQGVFNIVKQLTMERQYYCDLLRNMENLIESMTVSNTVPDEYVTQILQNLPYPSEAVYAKATNRV